MTGPWRFVRILWLDAYSEDPWTEIEKYDLRDHQVESFGYLVKESKNYHLIAPNVGQGDNGVWEGCALMAIPKADGGGDRRRKGCTVSDVDAILRDVGLDERPEGSTLLRYKAKDGKRLILLLHEGRETVYSISGDALSILLQDVAREAG